MKKEDIIATITAGLIGWTCWKFRKKIFNEFLTVGEYIEDDDYSRVEVEGHWRFGKNGKCTYVKPHYRKRRT